MHPFAFDSSIVTRDDKMVWTENAVDDGPIIATLLVAKDYRSRLKFAHTVV